MNENDANLDLDFTNHFAKPEAKASAASRVAGESYRAARAVNFVCFAKAPSGMVDPDPQAPVIVLEDHDASRRLLEKAIGLYGLPVRSAADVREFAKALRQPPRARLILLDVGLPRADGFQILTQLRLHPQTESIPVVLVTGRSANEDVIRGLSLGADGYLSKPVTLKALRSVLDTVLLRPSNAIPA